MNSQRSDLKQHSKIALAVLGVLFLGGIVCYKDRLLFVDSAYIAFNIIKDGHLQIQEHRYGSFVTQMVPWLGSKLHLPIKLILKAYTLSFNLFYLLAGILLYRLRRYALIIIMAMYYCLLVSDSYYWTNNEIHQAVAWMFIFYAVILTMGERKAKLHWLLPVFIALAFLAIYTHFIVLIPFMYLWFFLWIGKEDWPFSKQVSILLTVCIALIVSTKFLVVNDHSYDESRLHNITHLSLRDVLPAFVSGGVKVFFIRCLTNYWVVIIVFVTGVFALIKNRKSGILLYTSAAIISYIFIMGITYPNADFLQFHVESEWQSMAIVVGAPFVFYFLPAIDTRRAVILLSFIFIVRLVYIAAANDKFSWRTSFTKEVLQKMSTNGINKLAILNDPELKQKYILDWGVSEESMLMSAMQHDEPQRTFVFINGSDSGMLKILNNPKLVYACFDTIRPQSWNYEYFKPDTLQPYTIMTYSELFK